MAMQDTLICPEYAAALDFFSNITSLCALIFGSADGFSKAVLREWELILSQYRMITRETLNKAIVSRRAFDYEGVNCLRRAYNFISE